jgi:hypothetical protein
MEFKANLENETYSFTSINSTSFLVSSQNNSYILYKTSQWMCADQISPKLLKQLGEIIELHKNKHALS